MPELPDVQVFKETLDATSLHKRIADVHLTGDAPLGDVSASTVRRRLEGAELGGSRRHGKHLFADLGEDDGWLRLHFGMTGELEYWEGEDDPPEHAKLVLDFTGDGHLAYVVVRKIGQIDVVDDVEAFIEERGLGPDALDLDLGAFRERLDGRRGAIKGTLMNQEVLAGIGNVYADEILFAAGVHPEADTDGLGDDTVAEIHRAMGKVLEKAIDGRVEEFPDDFLLPRREDGAECPRCGGEIEKTEVSGRPTYLCPEHQSAGA